MLFQKMEPREDMGCTQNVCCISARITQRWVAEKCYKSANIQYFFTLKLAENFLLRHENNHRLQAITVKESSSISNSDKELVIREREFSLLIQEIKLNNLFEEVLDVSGTI